MKEHQSSSIEKGQFVTSSLNRKVYRKLFKSVYVPDDAPPSKIPDCCNNDISAFYTRNVI